MIMHLALFVIRLTLLVTTTLVLVLMAGPRGEVSSPVGSPLVVFHHAEAFLLPLLAVGWLLVWKASRVVRGGSS